VLAHLSPVARMEAALVAAEDVNKAARRRRWTAWGRATLRDEYFGLLHEAQNPPEHRKRLGKGAREHGVCDGLMAHLLQRADDAGLDSPSKGTEAARQHDAWLWVEITAWARDRGKLPPTHTTASLALRSAKLLGPISICGAGFI
jgi:hypothetical protein